MKAPLDLGTALNEVFLEEFSPQEQLDSASGEGREGDAMLWMHFSGGRPSLRELGGTAFEVPLLHDFSLILHPDSLCRQSASGRVHFQP